MEKRQKRDQELEGKTVCLAMMMILQKWQGKKEKDETVERFYLIYSQFLATVYSNITNLNGYSEQLLAFSASGDCRTSANISKTIILPWLPDCKAWSDVHGSADDKATVPSPEGW